MRQGRQNQRRTRKLVSGPEAVRPFIGRTADKRLFNVLYSNYARFNAHVSPSTPKISFLAETIQSPVGEVQPRRPRARKRELNSQINILSDDAARQGRGRCRCRMTAAGQTAFVTW
jgi:hypothetical protein